MRKGARKPCRRRRGRGEEPGAGQQQLSSCVCGCTPPQAGSGACLSGEQRRPQRDVPPERRSRCSGQAGPCAWPPPRRRRPQPEAGRSKQRPPPRPPTRIFSSGTCAVWLSHSFMPTIWSRSARGCEGGAAARGKSHAVQSAKLSNPSKGCTPAGLHQVLRGGGRRRNGFTARREARSRTQHFCGSEERWGLGTQASRPPPPPHPHTPPPTHELAMWCSVRVATPLQDCATVHAAGSTHKRGPNSNPKPK